MLPFMVACPTEVKGMERKRVVVAMSGGVDSSVAALILKKAGYDVVGVTMKLYSLDNQDLPSYYRGCCTVDDVEDARRVCHRLAVPHYVFNVEREFQSFVIDYFCSEYQKGRTPHPCIACNDRIKFSFLLQRAYVLSANYIATGHYARIEAGEGKLHLLKGIDTDKDQSYVLYGMGQEQLRHTLLPLGSFTKEEIRRMASEANFPNADKPDSQDICFIPMGDYRKFLAETIIPQSGPILDSQGAVLGQHSGIEFFTVGQRRRLGVAGSKPLYVTRIDPEDNTVVVGSEEELYSNEVMVSNVNYTLGYPPEAPEEVTVKLRYKAPYTEAILYPRGEEAMLRFIQPQRAVTPGQAAVFYRGEEVLGGGRIQQGRIYANSDKS